MHYVDGLAIDSGAEAASGASWPEEEVWRRYFEALAERGAEPALFDSLSHPDLIKDLRRRPARDDLVAR